MRNVTQSISEGRIKGVQIQRAITICYTGIMQLVVYTKG